MEPKKQDIQRQLVANVVMEQCRDHGGVIFRDTWHVYHRSLWFTTPFFRGLFSVKESKKGKWGTGDPVMLEVAISAQALSIACVLSAYDGAVPAWAGTRDALLAACGKTGETGREVTLRSWYLSSARGVNGLVVDFCSFLDRELPGFEAGIARGIKDPEEKKGLYPEGAPTSVTLNKYERNPKARAACIAAHGAVCAVCGMDFATTYGPAFEGIIEIHHTKPLSEIGEEYEVDPVQDLTPVCPNCHTALHSKVGGVYTVEELKVLFERNMI